MGEKAVEGDPYDLPDPDLKIILLGDSAVGKSKMIERYLMDEYNPRQVIHSYCLRYHFRLFLSLAVNICPHSLS
jgi:GTPase SAR1 family protein